MTTNKGEALGCSSSSKLFIEPQLQGLYDYLPAYVCQNPIVIAICFTPHFSCEILQGFLGFLFSTLKKPMGLRDRLHRGSSWCPEQHGQLTHHLTTLFIGEDLPWQPWHQKKGGTFMDPEMVGIFSVFRCISYHLCIYYYYETSSFWDNNCLDDQRSMFFCGTS